MQYHNFHTHSIYSDGKYTLREMTDAAIEKGFTNLGFSDHSNNRVESYYCMMSDGKRSYRKKVSRKFPILTTTTSFPPFTKWQDAA